MTKMTYALTMMGAALIAPSARAALLSGSFDNDGTTMGSTAHTETFEVETTSALAGIDSSFVVLPLIDDSLGNTGIGLEDNGDGSGTVATGILSTGVSGTSLDPFVSTAKVDFIKPSIYTGGTSGFVLTPGSYTGSYGSVLTLAAVPEPEAWALMLAGTLVTGVTLRASRRKRPLAEAA